MDKFKELVEMHHSNRTGACRHYMFLYSVVLGMESKNVFEFGSGYSSKAMLFALEETDGYLTSCDCRPFWQSCGHYFEAEAELEVFSNRWTYIHKRSLDAQHEIQSQSYDVVFHDGSHTWREVAEDLKCVIPRMKKNGILMLHDTNHPTDNYQLDRAVDRIDANVTTSQDGGFEIERLSLPYGYGLTMVRVLQDFGHGEVDIKWRKQQSR